MLIPAAVDTFLPLSPNFPCLHTGKTDRQANSALQLILKYAKNEGQAHELPWKSNEGMPKQHFFLQVFTVLNNYVASKSLTFT